MNYKITIVAVIFFGIFTCAYGSEEKVGIPAGYKLVQHEPAYLKKCAECNRPYVIAYKKSFLSVSTVEYSNLYSNGLIKSVCANIDSEFTG